MGHARDGSATGEREITSPVDLCLSDGRLNRAAVGWSRAPLHRCNLSGRWGRKKRWDYWCVTTDEHLLAVTVADLDYVGIADVYFVDFAGGGAERPIRRSAATPFARGLQLPDTVGGGAIHVDALGLAIDLVPEQGGTRLLVKARGVAGPRIEADVLVELPPGHETLGVVIPWSDRLFQYTSKHNTRPARGRVVAGGREHLFGPANHAFGCLDFGRGIWPYRSSWNWASASGIAGGRAIGLQLGGIWTDGTGMNENAICVDGALHKIGERLVFSYDRASFMAPWRIRSDDGGAVLLSFEPLFERRSRIALGVAESGVHQLFGRFSGTVRAGGEAIAVHDLFGWAEEHRARW